MNVKYLGLEGNAEFNSVPRLTVHPSCSSEASSHSATRFAAALLCHLGLPVTGGLHSVDITDSVVVPNVVPAISCPCHVCPAAGVHFPSLPNPLLISF